ncbi:MAG: dihydropteroate synthase [Actinomycetota bacterium]
MRLELGELIGSGHCLVMGVLNRTPDSFYDGGRIELDDATEHGLRLVAEGADLLDVGAIKAGPGEEVSQDEERSRLLPLVEALVRESDVPIAIETGRPRLAAEALELGATMLNDVTGLADDGLARVAAEHRAWLLLMHNGGQIRGRPRHPRYEDVVSSVISSWREMATRAHAKGVPPDRIVVDPGIDFGKTTFHSLELLRRLPELREAGWPLLVAPSRKDVIGETLDLPVEERLEGTLALVALCARERVDIARVHDVAAAARVVRIIEAVDGRRPPAAPVRGLWD